MTEESVDNIIPKPGPGRPVKLKTCVVCGLVKKSSLFPPDSQTGVPGRCRACSRLARLAKAESKEARAAEQAHAKALVRQQAQLKKQDISVEHKEERAELRRIKALRKSPKIAILQQEYEERLAISKAMRDTTEFFKKISRPTCSCCYYEWATGQDSIGARHWCTLCGWGVERTGRCLAHPGEVYYAGLPQEGVTLPPELLATMRVPAPPLHINEAPDREPDEGEESGEPQS